MTTNVGGADRAIRAVAGLLLLVLAFAGILPAGAIKIAGIVIGLILVATAALRFCPAYLPFGIRTCQTK